MSNPPNSKYAWGDHLPKMIRLYETGMSIPDICKNIQDEATHFTPGQSMVYIKFRSEGYPTDKSKRDEYLKELNLSRKPHLRGLGNGSRSRQMIPATPLGQTNEIYNDASHTESSSAHAAIAQQTSTQSIGVTRNLVHLHGSNVSYGADHSDPFGSSNDFEFSNGPDLGAMNGSFPFPTWTAKLPQRQTTFDIEPNSFPHMHQSSQIYQNPAVDSDSFNSQAGSNNSTLLDYDGSQHIPPPWEFEGYGEHQDFNTQAVIMNSTSQLPLLAETDGGLREEDSGGMTWIPQPSLTTRETHLESVSAVFLEDQDASRPTSVGDRDVVMDSFSNPAVDTHESRNGTWGNRSSSLRSRNTPSPVTNSPLNGRMIPWLNPKARPGHRYVYKRSSTPEKRDSGYDSGRNSPLTKLVEESHPHPRSLLEFKGLYRVPCQRLHEPQELDPFYIPKSMDRFKDIATCAHCHYSSIHNLGWSARYLTLTVFESDLKLDTKYDVTALDTVGNSALHYAASNGAGFDHFTALIQAGVNPYQLNTAGQLFLHCLRPHLRETGSEGFDEDLVAVFNADLINLLNCFQPKGAFRWRDNEGRTVLDTLASNITDTEMRARTFRLVKDAGYPLDVSNQFPITKSKKGRPNNPSPTNEVDFRTTEERQQKAYQILGQASVEPSYVDPDTGDNVLHALARLKLPERRSLLSKIREFVLKEIDLNLPNRDRDCPLAAFISERPFLGKENDETGATMSKYLDALLWKDPRRRIANKINVNMRNREGATALYYAAIRARPDSVRSLIEAGANVNARLDVGGHKISVLQATKNAKAQAVHEKNELKIYQFDEVISYLEHDDAVADPSPFEERAVCENSVRVMPM